MKLLMRLPAIGQLLVFGLILNLTIASAQSKTWYVATTGNDNNPGTTSQPWRTLQKAVESIAAGDTILVRAGTYAGCRIERSGQQNAVKTLKAEPGATVIINAPGAKCRHSSNLEIENFSETVKWWVIDGLEVKDAPKHGIDVRGTDYITVQNCYSHDNGKSFLGDGILLGFSDHPTLQFNEVAYNSEHGIYHSNSADYPIIRGNRSHHNKRGGFHLNGDLSLGGDGIISFALIEKNIIWENGVEGASGINCDGVTDSIIRNNLLYNNRATGIALYGIDGGVGSSRNKVYNNTIVQPANGRWCIDIPAADGRPSPTGNIIRNNILWNAHSFRGAITTYSNAVNGFASDYNIVVGRFSTNDGSSNLTLAQWQALGYDQHSLIATPADLFVDATNNNFQLRANSPALNAGTTVSEVTEDITGLARPQGSAFDPGCYEVLQNANAVTCVSAASYQGGAMAAEIIVAAFGSRLATSVQASAVTPLPTTMAGTTVRVRDSNNIERNAPLFFVSPTQVNYLLPAGTATGSGTVTITAGDGSVATGTIQVATTAPGLFAANADGQGLAAGLILRVRADNSQSYEPVAVYDTAQSRFIARPIDFGVSTDQLYLVLFGTGFRHRSALSAVTVRIGGVNLSPAYAGPQGDLTGLDQVNVLLPRALAGAGEINVELTADGRPANTIRISIR